ncbi:MAG: 7-carboxy-7-deazaguanine synthase QueE [Phycisphaerae bacterium]|nr:7-carboxy-7-deazaguanine synthase QueE [Phycisphaerae bacterium]
MARLLINELFFSIQGESSRIGLPCVFVRLRGCHLRCRYCDTEYAFSEGEGMEIDEIIESISAWPCRLVQVTGGEPLLQKPVHELMERLCDLGWTVLIETSGACDIAPCDERVIRIVDVKTPGSGESERNHWANLEQLRPRDEVKFVIVDRVDYDWMRDVIERYGLEARVDHILASPVNHQAPGREIAGCEALSMRTLAEWMLADGLGVRMQPQLHKAIWDPSTRGV